MLRFLFLLAVLLLVGCGADQSQSDLIRPPQSFQTEAFQKSAGAYGFVSAGSGGGLRVSQQGGGGGQGLTLQVRNLAGDVVAELQTDANGSFRLTDLPSGPLTIELGPNSQFSFTSIPGADLPLGAVYPFTRQQILATVLAQAKSTDAVFGTLQPLPAGVTLSASASDEVLQVLPADQWLFFLDPQPLARYGHPVEYLLVDANTGQVQRISNQFSVPAVNGARLWVGDLSFLHYLNLDLDTPSNTRFENGPEVVRLPQQFAVQSKRKPEVEARPRLKGAGSDEIFAILLQAEDENSSYPSDIQHVRKFLISDQGVPEDQVYAVKTSIESLPKMVDSQGQLVNANGQRPFTPETSRYHLLLGEIRGRIEDRLQRGLHSTLIVYITAHDSTQGFTAQYRGGRHINWKPDALDLKSVRACKIRVLCDFCYSASVFPDFRTYFERSNVPPEQRPDLQVFSACDTREQSLGIPVWLASLGDRFAEFLFPDEFVAPIILAPGGMWTNSILRLLRIEDGDLVGLLRPDGSLRVDSVFLGGAPANSDYLGTTHPKALVLANIPSYCPGRVTFLGDYALNGPGSLASVRFKSSGELAMTFPSVSSGAQFNAPATITGLEIRSSDGAHVDTMDLRGTVNATITGDQVAGTLTFLPERTGKTFQHTFTARLSPDRRSMAGNFTNPGDETSAIQPAFEMDRLSESAPEIQSFVPGEANTGDTVQIGGNNLGDISARVFFNGIEAAVPQFTAGNLIVRVPPGNTSGPITVAAASSVSTNSQFRLRPNTATPVVSSVSPSEVRQGETVTIYGTGLGGANARVEVGNTFATQVGGDDRSLRAVVALSAFGRGRVIVTNGGNRAFSTNSVHVVPSGLTRWRVDFDPGSTEPFPGEYFTVIPTPSAGGQRLCTVTTSGGTVVSGAGVAGLETLQQEVDSRNLTFGLAIGDRLNQGVVEVVFSSLSAAFPINVQDGSFAGEFRNRNFLGSFTRPAFINLQTLTGNLSRTQIGSGILDGEWWPVQGVAPELHNQ